MAICVDRIRTVDPSGKWPFRHACHLYDDEDNLERLHNFAVEILGLKRSWFQNRIRFPHYDLTKGKRRIAVAMGAKERERKEERRTISGSRGAWLGS